MKDNYYKSFELVIGEEGGYQNDYHDRGNWTSGKVGRGKLKGTKYGITAMQYPKLDIPNLTLDDARKIYKNDYWDRCVCDSLPLGIDYYVFDIGVNHGVGDGIRFVQEAVETDVDGQVGPLTMKAIEEANPIITIGRLLRIRQYDYTNIGTWDRYGKGWSRRNANVAEEALAMLATSDQSNEQAVSGDQDQTYFFGLLKKVNH